MEIVNSVHCNRDLAKPKDWNEQKLGPCNTLPIMDYKDPNGVEFMVSFWKPDADDLEKLNAGHSICLGINGKTHPVVFVSVTAVTV